MKKMWLISVLVLLGIAFAFGVVECGREAPVLVSPCSGSYETVLKEGISLTILQNAPSYAAEGKFVKDYQVTTHVDGPITCGYLYIRASVGGLPLNDKYDSVYMTCADLGGHLMRTQSLPLPHPVVGATELLFPLDMIPFIPHAPYNPTATNFQVADWVEVLNAKDKVRFWIGLSTLNPAGVIDEVKIVYNRQ